MTFAPNSLTDPASPATADLLGFGDVMTSPVVSSQPPASGSALLLFDSPLPSPVALLDFSPVASSLPPPAPQPGELLFLAPTQPSALPTTVPTHDLLSLAPMHASVLPQPLVMHQGDLLSLGSMPPPPVPARSWGPPRASVDALLFDDGPATPVARRATAGEALLKFE